MAPAPSSHPIDLVSGIRPGPVLLGVAVDWALTVVFSLFLTQAFLDPGLWDVPEGDFDSTYAAEIDAMLTNTDFLLASLVFGALATAIGGYVAASKAATLQLKYGLMVAVVSGLTGLLVGLLPGESSSPPLPFWYDLAGWCVLIPAGILGGYVARRRANSGTV